MFMGILPALDLAFNAGLVLTSLIAFGLFERSISINP
jgi:hypothetical protein